MTGTVDSEIHTDIADWNQDLKRSQRRNRDQLRSTLIDLKPDIVHVIHPLGNVLPVIWRDFPVITTFWGLNIGRGAKWMTRAKVLLLLWGSQVLASHDFKLIDQMRQLCLGMRQVHFLPVGSNIFPSPAILQAPRQDLRRRYHLDIDGQYLAYFGGYDPNMGVTDLFQAVRRLRDEGHDRLRLLLIGWQRHLQDPCFLPIKQAIEREQVEDVLMMTPFAPDEEVAGLLRAADLVVLPYRHNSMGRTSLMAALGAGAPVVLASSLADLGPLQGAVVQVPPQSPQILAHHIESLLQDPHRVKQLAISGRQAWEKNFSWQAISQRHLQLYQRLIKNKSVSQ
jgi:glycosyltransferase involved in cell wall biosynthesis